MSLNQLTIQGKIGDGIDIDCKSISTDPSSGSLIRGALTVQGLTDLQGNVTCESKLDVVGQANFFGTLKQKSKVIDMNGQQLYANLNISSSQVNNFVSIPFNYQKYGNVLHITGVIVCDVINVANSKLIECKIDMPTGYTLLPATPNTRFFPISGSGVYTTGVGTSLAVWVCSQATPSSASSYIVRWNTGSGSNAITFVGQLVLTLDLYLDGVVG